MDSHGVHEIVVETPRHDLSPALLSVAQQAALLKTYRERYRSLSREPHISQILIIKNHREEVGKSPPHPHSQILALPVVPTQVTDRIVLLDRYHQRYGCCLACDLVEEELSASRRVIEHSQHFVAFVPYAALSSYHIWVMPRRHVPSFRQTNDKELQDLSHLLRNVLRRLHYGLADPDYSYVLRSAPRTPDRHLFHWYLSIVPQLAQKTGVALGSGMYVNSSIPEDDAEFLRSVELPQTDTDSKP